jgi:hypothetical protein
MTRYYRIQTYLLTNGKLLVDTNTRGHIESFVTNVAYNNLSPPRVHVFKFTGLCTSCNSVGSVGSASRGEGLVTVLVNVSTFQRFRYRRCAGDTRTVRDQLNAQLKVQYCILTLTLRLRKTSLYTRVRIHKNTRIISSAPAQTSVREGRVPVTFPFMIHRVSLRVRRSLLFVATSGSNHPRLALR